MTPGQAEHAQDELRLADQALGSARRELEAGALEDAASRLYYAIFHAIRAALTVRGQRARTHKGLIHLYQQSFGATPLIDRLFELRATADYEIERFNASSDEIGQLITEAAVLVDVCRTHVISAVVSGPDTPDPPPDH